MNRLPLASLIGSMILALAACESGNADPADLGGADAPDAADARDVRDTGRPDTAAPDTNVPDTTPPDAAGPDGTPADLPVADVPVADLPVADVPPTDVTVPDAPPADTPAPDATPGDTPPADTAVPDALDPDAVAAQCSGACDAASDKLRCLTDAATICFCNGDTGNWEPYACADVCQQNGTSGTACIQGTDGPTCDCRYDCQNATQVAAQCEEMAYTPCTCGAADPCKWVADGYCDSACAWYFPEDHLVDQADCNCTGLCTASSFTEFCDLTGAPCTCGSGGTVALGDCGAYCGNLGASVSTSAPCFVSTADGSANCNCDEFQCVDTGKVDAQCAAGIYTPCTCGMADPCGWATDADYCDSPSCEQRFPDQANFDDSATAPCQQ